ncbi:hypothetical protein BHM03_00012629 [Ensete ventricosum]|nr:hypothetical protein BHM03_00012629 [Ensete ventricosum]
MDSVKKVIWKCWLCTKKQLLEARQRGKLDYRGMSRETYQDHLLGGSGHQNFRGKRVELPRQLGMEKSPFELLRCR